MSFQGNILVLLILFAWIPVVLLIYLRYPANRAVIISFIAAWLFLPVAAVDFQGIPDLTKMSATSYGVLLATAIYDSSRFNNFRFKWIDTPMVLWCIAPFISSIANDLGPYDGFSSMLNTVVAWGIPYFVGRLYLGSLDGLKQLAIGIFVGALVYVPLCLYEARMFTSLHITVYGMNTGREWGQSIRYGGYRPQVFMEHGLMLGVWLMTACIVGVVLWRTGIVKSLWNLPVGLLMAILLFTFIYSRSTGAYALFLLGSIFLWMAWKFRSTLGIWIVIVLSCVYLSLGVSNTLPRNEILSVMSQVFEADRVSSVRFRFDNEHILSEKASQQMLFGWGGFGRNRVLNEYGKDISITDSLWIIAYGINGVFGLASLMSAILLPSVAFIMRYPAKLWRNPHVAPAAALAICIILYMLDCILNAMVNPIFMLANGGIATVVMQSKRSPMVSKRYRQAQKLAGA